MRRGQSRYAIRSVMPTASSGSCMSGSLLRGMVKMRLTGGLAGNRQKVVVMPSGGTKPVTVRWSQGAHKVVVHEAELEGIPLARYMREASLARAFYAIGRRAGGGKGEGFAERLCHLTQELDDLGID